MAALYAKENYPLGIVEQLRLLGHDLLTARDAAKINRAVPDEEVLQFATEQSRAVITLNRLHFIRLHGATGGKHAGIIVCTFDPEAGRQAGRVHSAITETGSLYGKLLRVYRPQA